MSLEGAAESADHSRIEIEGVVCVPPGVLGRQFLHLERESRNADFSSQAMFPDLDYGDTVHVRGKNPLLRVRKK